VSVSKPDYSGTVQAVLPDEAKNTYAMIQATAAFHCSSAIEREINKGTVKSFRFI